MFFGSDWNCTLDFSFMQVKKNSNRVLRANIFPNGFPDHHVCMLEILKKF